MRFVSYTRATSGMVGETLPPDTIQQQNAAIHQFCKSRSWKIQKKYCDKGDDPQRDTAFQNMKADGVVRRFDCVVANSAYTLAPTVFMANDLLQKIFVPIQIHFAIVEDNFYSAEHSAAEVANYLQSKVKASKDKRLYQAATIFYNRLSTQKFGYSYDETIDNFQIVPEEAKIVRQIFTMRADGLPMIDIAKRLNEQGIEGPRTQCCKRLALQLPAKKEQWTSGKINFILDSVLYCGVWERTVRGKKQAKECPAIVTCELSETVRRKREYNRKPLPPNRHEFLGLMVDEETGYALSYYILPRTREPIIRFKYPKPTAVVYDTMWMKCDELSQQVKQALRQQKMMANQAKALLSSEVGKLEKQRRLKMEQLDARPVFFEQLQLESEDVSLRKKFESGDFSEQEFNAAHEDNRKQFDELERKMQEHMNRMQELEVAYSDKNPWIRLYEKIDLRKQINQTVAKKLILQIRCTRFERIRLIPQELDWLEKFPKSWFQEVE